MTTRKLSGLELARKWMDSLGMRHYGEVDAAIAEAGAGASGYSDSQYAKPVTGSPEFSSHTSRVWQNTGFAAHASSALEGQRSVDEGFTHLFDHTGSTSAPPHASPAEEQVWNDALQAAKDLVNSPSPKPKTGAADIDMRINGDAGSAGEVTTTLDLHVTSASGDKLGACRSVDVTCRSNSTLAIHLWI